MIAEGAAAPGAAALLRSGARRAIPRGLRAPRAVHAAWPDIAGLRGRRRLGWSLRPAITAPSPTVLPMHGRGCHAAEMRPVVQPLHAAGCAVPVHGRGDRSVPFEDACRLPACATKAELLPVTGDHGLRHGLVPHGPALLRPLRAAPGRPAVVVLWASWCAPCREEMPLLAAAQQREAGVRFLFVNQGESAATVGRYLAGLPYAVQDVLLDAGAALGPAVGSPGLPTTLFYDARGRRLDAHFGVLNAAALESRLRPLRAGPPPAR